MFAVNHVFRQEQIHSQREPSGADLVFAIVHFRNKSNVLLTRNEHQKFVEVISVFAITKQKSNIARQDKAVISGQEKQLFLASTLEGPRSFSTWSTLL
jgi:hypothetical protein